MSYYELLTVNANTDRRELQHAFHRFALVFHPDVNRSEDEEVQEAAKRVFARGVEAYSVLRNPDLALFYREQVADGTRRLTSSDFGRFARQGRQRSLPPPAPDDTFVDQMATLAGRVAAQRLEALIAYRRFRDAMVQIGWLVELEPDNHAVAERAEQIIAYLKHHGEEDPMALEGETPRSVTSDLDRTAERERQPSVPYPSASDTFVGQMKTLDGRVAAQRLEALIAYRRIREAHQQLALLETLEPDNDAVRKRADEIAAFLRRTRDEDG